MRFLSLFFTVCIFSTYASTPTEKYLNEFPIEQIICIVDKYSAIDRGMGDHLNIFYEAIANEDEYFFGYHATTISHFAYQEIVKTVLEKVFQETFREDFYFLRAPGAPAFDIKGIDDFFVLFEPNLNIEEKKRFIELCFIRTLESISGKKFPAITIEDDTAADIYEVLVNSLASGLYPLSNGDAVLFAFIRNYDMDQEDRNAFEGALFQWLKSPLDVFYEYEDLRYSEYDFVVKQFDPYDDTRKEQQQLLTSLNISLFAHHTIPTESTVHVFMRGQSIDLDLEDFEYRVLNQLRKFIMSAGMPSSFAEDCWTLAKSKLEFKNGVLLQMFAPFPERLDEVAYMCATYGRPMNDVKVSEYIPSFDPQKCEKLPLIDGEELIIHPQVRLVATHAEVLNPYSWLKVKVYTAVPQKDLKDFKEALRKLVEEVKMDKAQAESFRHSLEQHWRAA